MPERRPNVVRCTETRFTGSRKPTTTQPLDPTADREASDGRDCGGRGTGRRMPQGGGIPGEPGRRTGGEIQRRRPNRQRDQTPEARPRRTSIRRQARVTDDPGSGNGDPKGKPGTINRAVKGICGCIESARDPGRLSAERDHVVAPACRMPIAGGDVASRGVDDRCQVKL